MEGLKTWRKPLDNIPAEDAKTIADLVLKVDKSGILIKTGEDSILLVKLDPNFKIQQGAYL